MTKTTLLGQQKSPIKGFCMYTKTSGDIETYYFFDDFATMQTLNNFFFNLAYRGNCNGTCSRRKSEFT